MSVCADEDKTDRQREKETWRGDMETWRHGDMETWRHGDMETWRHGDMERRVGGCHKELRISKTSKCK